MGPRVAGWARVAATTGVVVAADQGLKQLAIASVEPGRSRNVFFGIDLTNTRNTGVAFGAFPEAGTIVALLIAVALIGLLAFFATHASLPWLWLPTGMLLGGALGNLADRARDGAVIDYIDPSFWPAFNLADASIVVAVLGLLYIAER
ncbi:MAG TPA: signal peptidase II [Thermoleophilaceae bacterium]|nr:signal peptidase II [Thermoleophilaceae bacterium]